MWFSEGALHEINYNSEIKLKIENKRIQIMSIKIHSSVN